MTVSVAGSFHYYVTSGADPGPLCDGYLSVDPELPRGLPLESLVCQTVLAKLLGPLASWRDKLEVAYRWVPCHVSRVTRYKLHDRSGYNMLHFTPIQRLGASNSAYSLADQLALNATFTTAGGGEASHEDVKRIGGHRPVLIIVTS